MEETVEETVEETGVTAAALFFPAADMGSGVETEELEETAAVTAGTAGAVAEPMTGVPEIVAVPISTPFVAVSRLPSAFFITVTCWVTTTSSTT